ncbi:hypothetical protein B0H14DRAFT_3604205 [Mycena olivaceomarginata]|nr:hypothetical protein B0H14DRAFT_3604205 [Mycena olivaceomarginata]
MYERKKSVVAQWLDTTSGSATAKGQPPRTRWMPEQVYNCSMIPVLQGPPPRVTWILVEGSQQQRALESAAPCLPTQTLARPKGPASQAVNARREFLWAGIAYAAGDMSADARTDMLDVLDGMSQFSKRNLILGGETTVARLLLHSPHFEQLLVNLLEGFKDRYYAPTRLGPAGTSCRDAVAPRLESHDRMIASISNALRARSGRSGRSSRIPERSSWSPGLKRKSEATECW